MDRNKYGINNNEGCDYCGEIGNRGCVFCSPTEKREERNTCSKPFCNERASSSSSYCSAHSSKCSRDGCTGRTSSYKPYCSDTCKEYVKLTASIQQGNS